MSNQTTESEKRTGTEYPPERTAHNGYTLIVVDDLDRAVEA